MAGFLYSRSGTTKLRDTFFSLSSLAGCLFALPACFICCSVFAQQTKNPSKREPAAHREIRVDAKKLPQILNEKWETVLRKDYLEWKTTLQHLRHAPPEVSIEKADYFAEIAGENITGGSVKFEIRNRSRQAVSLPLDPLNLHLYDLEIESRSAIWGSGSDGKTSLLAPPGQSTVTGRWKLSGKRLFPCIARKVFRYRFDLPQANSGSLSIALPRDWSLKSDSGIVREPSTNDISKRSLWKIDLGRSTECVVTVMSKNSSPRKKTVMFADSDTTYFLSREGLEFRYRLQLEILEKPEKALSFLVPEGLKIASVRLGNDQNLSFVSPAPKNPRLLRIPFRDAKRGNLGPLILTGYSSYPLNRYWSLPEIRLQNAVEKNARTHLIVENPVQLQDIRHRGYRQTDFTTVGDNQTRRSYRKILPKAKLTVFLNRPPARSQVEIFTHYNIQPDELRFESLVRWSAKNGAAFNLTWSLPERWDVVAVELEDRDGKFAPANWFYGDGSNSPSRSLQIDAGRAVVPGEPVLLRLSCRRSLRNRDVPIEFDLPGPQNADVLQHVVGISTNPALRHRLNKKISWREISSTEIPDNLATLPSVQRILTSRLAADIAFYLSNGEGKPGTLGVRRSEANYRASAEILVRRDVDRIAERCQLYIEPIDQAVRTVVVYSPRKDLGYSWQFHDPQMETPVDLQFSVLDASLHTRWNVPPEGVLMELRLPLATKKPFGLVGTTSRTASLVETPSLVFLPAATEFRGSLRLEADSTLRLQPMTNLLQSSRIAIPKTTEEETGNSFRVVGSWKYSDPSQELSVHVLNPGQNIALSATVFLESKISASDAYHIHTADYRLNSSIFSGTFEFQLDADTELLSLVLNGRPVRFSRNATLIQLPSLPVNRQNNVRILYRQRAEKVFWNQKLEIPLPIASVNLLGMRWKLDLPPGLRLCGIPDSFQFEEMPSPRSWIQRFFGPLQVKGRAGSNSLSMTSPQTEELPTTTTSQEDGAGVPILISAFVPAKLTVTLQSQSSRTSILWGLLFLGSFLSFVTRYYFSSTRSRAILMGIILLALAATIVLPERPAQYSGSLLFGIVLSLLVRIGHRVEIEGRTKSESQYANEFSGFRLKSPVRLTGLLFAIAFLSGSLGTISGSSSQNPASELQIPIPSDEEVVLIPFVESEGKETPLDVVYMSKTLEQRLSRDLKKFQQQKYYIASASYRGISKTENAIETVANFKVLLPESTERVEISLPFEGVVLEGENSCLVDGKPFSLRRSPTGTGYILDYIGDGNRIREESANSKSRPMKHKEIDIELSFRIPIRKDESFEKIGIAIPPIADSAMTIDFGRTYSNIVMSLDGQIVQAKTDLQIFSAEFGPATRLSLIWNDKRDSKREKTPTPFDMNTIVDVSPSSIQVANSLKIESLSEAISHLVLRIPSNAIFRHLKANSLKTYYRLQSGSNAILIAVEFQTPQRSIDDFVWKYEILRNTESQQLGRLTIPESISRVPLHGNFEKHNHVVGFTSRLEYELHIPNRSPESWTVLQPDDTLADALKFLSPVTPVAVYRVNEPAKLHCTLAGRKTVQEVIQKQSFRFRESEAQWTLEANLRTSGQRNFRYSLKIDPRIEVENVSVLKDRVERLARWNRHKDSIHLILKESLSAPLQIVIRGSIPFQPSQPFRFPKIAWDDLNIADSIVEIAHSRNLVVDSQNSHFPKKLERISDTKFGSEWLYWGAVRSSPNDDNLNVTFLALRDVIKSEIFTIIDLGSARKLQIRNIFRFSGLKEIKRDFEISIPEMFSENMTLQTDGVEATARISESGERYLVIGKQNLGDDPAIVMIVSEIDRPIEGNWDLPLIQIEGLPFAKRFLALDRAIFQPARKNPFVFRDSDIPRWVEPFLSTGEINTNALSYRTAAESLALDYVEGHSPQGRKIAIPLAELSLWTNSEEREQGSLRLHILTREAETLSIVIPKSVRPHTLLVNRRQIPIPASQERIREIPLDSSLDRQLVEIFWQKNHTSGNSFLGRLRHEIPFPDGIPVERTLTNIVLPKGYRTFSLRGAKVLKRPERLLQRLEGLAEMGYFRPQSDGNREFESSERELSELLQSDPSLQNGSNDFRKRFRKIVSQTEDKDTTKKRERRDTKPGHGFHERFDRIYLLKSESGSVFHASLEMNSEMQFIEYRLWNDTATRCVCFAVILLLVIPAAIWIFRKPWFDRLAIPLYFRTCLLGAVGLVYWQWDWLGIALLVAGLLQLAFREKQRRQATARFEQPSSHRDTTASTIAS